MRLTNVNNFDLIRLFAALEVVIVHASKHLHFDNPILEMFSFFPGVPVFFFISGFLIYASYQSSQSGEKPIWDFFVKRFLRLYPALIFCFVFSVVLVRFSGYLHTVEYSIVEFLVWAFTSLSIFQFYNPNFLREFGVGAINGSLWTISVELQFYLLTPLIFWFLRKSLTSITLLVIIFSAINVLNSQFNSATSIIEKLFVASFLPWVYMFFLGAIFSSRLHWAEKLMRLDTRIVFLAYFVVWWTSNDLGLGWGNKINPVAYSLLVVLILKAAFSKPMLSDKLLGRNDISYGIYIFHMPIINYLIHINLLGSSGFILAIISTIIMAIVSWLVVEKPTLKLKRIRIQSVSSKQPRRE